MVGTVSILRVLAASTRPWPARMTSSSSIRTGTRKPNWEIPAASNSTCLLPWVRAFRGLGLSSPGARGSMIPAHGLRAAATAAGLVVGVAFFVPAASVILFMVNSSTPLDGVETTLGRARESSIPASRSGLILQPGPQAGLEGPTDLSPRCPSFRKSRRSSRIPAYWLLQWTGMDRWRSQAGRRCLAARSAHGWGVRAFPVRLPALPYSQSENPCSQHCPRLGWIGENALVSAWRRLSGRADSCHSQQNSLLTGNSGTRDEFAETAPTAISPGPDQRFIRIRSGWKRSHRSACRTTSRCR